VDAGEGDIVTVAQEGCASNRFDRQRARPLIHKLSE
jgi:hypothetical protein